MSNYITLSSDKITQLRQSINNIATDCLNQWVHVMRNEQNTKITATTHLSFLLGLNEFYMITTSQDITIYLPVIADVSQLGVRLIFRRGYGQYSQNVITFMSECPGQAAQTAFNLSNSYPAIMGPNMYTITFVSLANSLNPHWSWYQI